MTRWLLCFVEAGLLTAFERVFFGSFLRSKREPREEGWFLGTVSLCCGIFGVFISDGIYGWLMYLLGMVLTLLYVFDEAGAQGLGLMCFGTVTAVCADTVASLLPFPLLTGVLGGCLSLGIGLLLRRLRRSSDRAPDRQTEELFLRQHMELQRESMAALEQSYRMQRKSAHEFEHHLQVLRDLMERGETEAARTHLARLQKDRAILVTSVNSKHPVVDVILNQKYQTARENDIRMQIRVNDLSAVTLPSDSLVVVLTNLLDNAIEACRRLDGDREIFCSVLFDEGLYISIRNTSQPVAIVNGRIPTSKQDSLSHGFGLMSVGYVLDTFDAEYTFGYEEGWFHFVAEIA